MLLKWIHDNFCCVVAVKLRFQESGHCLRQAKLRSLASKLLKDFAAGDAEVRLIVNFLGCNVCHCNRALAIPWMYFYLRCLLSC